MKEIYTNIVTSLITNFDSIQAKIEAIMSTDKALDVKQISDIERYVSMQESIVETLSTVERMPLGEK